MDRATENALKVSLTKKIQEWWEVAIEENIPYTGDDISEIMATAAIAVLLGIADAQEYMQAEGLIKEDESRDDT